jgi:hypothetical protein
MNSFVIEPVETEEQHAAASYVRTQVFEHEWGIRLPGLDFSDRERYQQLLARVSLTGEPVGTLTLADTTGQTRLHRQYGLAFEPNARVARYTRLAVIAAYRGLNLPLALVFQANWRFVAPGKFDYTWLLFDASRAESSSFSRLLLFKASSDVLRTEYGLSRVLVRDERALTAMEVHTNGNSNHFTSMAAFASREPSVAAMAR